MLRLGRVGVGRPSLLTLVKELTGRRIELRRRQQQMTQASLAGDVGIGVRWLREIEAGNPKSRIDDHLLCADRLGISSGQIMIPMLIMEHDMNCPRHVLLADLTDLERRCVELIGDNLAMLARRTRMADCVRSGRDG